MLKRIHRRMQRGSRWLLHPPPGPSMLHALAQPHQEWAMSSGQGRSGQASGWLSALMSIFNVVATQWFARTR
jgi:hypothetical protein